MKRVLSSIAVATLAIAPSAFIDTPAQAQDHLELRVEHAAQLADSGFEVQVEVMVRCPAGFVGSVSARVIQGRVASGGPAFADFDTCTGHPQRFTIHVPADEGSGTFALGRAAVTATLQTCDPDLDECGVKTVSLYVQIRR
ncbi:hypothetical protein ABZ926_14755 [Streptomyces litmocidini]|uniref:hypothetical protein n=1 Tax=Streptomyces litmocidini TaxID=67318 RepID=UPI0033E98416